MLPSPDVLAERLQNNDWSDTTDSLMAAVRDRQPGWLVDLIVRLDGEPGWAPPRLQRLAIEALAVIPGSVPYLAACLPPSYFVPRGRHADEGERSLAARLGASQPPGALTAALPLSTSPHWTAILAMWIQESVARGADLRHDAAVSAFWSALDHPLASLPLHPLPIEVHAQKFAGRYTATSAGSWGGGPLWNLNQVELPGTPAPPKVTRRSLRVEQQEALAAAYASTVAHNGKVEVAVFSLGAPLRALSRPVVASLRLSCFSNRSAREDRPFRPVTAPPGLKTQAMRPDEAYALLLSAAALGGCTNLAWSAAWGRRDAWRSLAALSGASGSFAEIAATAERCQWATFRSPSDWFYGVSIDEVAVCLRPDGRSIAVFAGTDTD